MSYDGYLRFDYRNVGYVIDGLEDATVRFELERDFQHGDEIFLLTPDDFLFYDAVVVDVWTGPVRDALEFIEASDRSHPATTVHELHRQLNEAYRAIIEVDDEVTVVAFNTRNLGGGSHRHPRAVSGP